MTGVPWCESIPCLSCLKKRALALACLVSNECIISALCKGVGADPCEIAQAILGESVVPVRLLELNH